MNQQWVRLAIREIAVSVGRMTPDEMASRISILAATRCYGDALALAFVAEFWNVAEQGIDDDQIAHAIAALYNVDRLYKLCEEIKRDIGGTPPPVVTQLSERDVHDAMSKPPVILGRPAAHDRGGRGVASAVGSGGAPLPDDGAPPSVEGWEPPAVP